MGAELVVRSPSRLVSRMPGRSPSQGIPRNALTSKAGAILTSMSSVPLQGKA